MMCIWLLVFSLDYLLGWHLPGVSTVKLFFTLFVINKDLVRRDFETVDICFLINLSLTGVLASTDFSWLNYYYDVAKCWFSVIIPSSSISCLSTMKKSFLLSRIYSFILISMDSWVLYSMDCNLLLSLFILMLRISHIWPVGTTSN